MRAPAPLREGNGDARHGNEEAGHKEERVRAVLPEDSSPRNEVSNQASGISKNDRFCNAKPQPIIGKTLVKYPSVVSSMPALMLLIASLLR